jgi:hypothetical protein
MAYSECLLTRLNPLAERTCFSLRCWIITAARKRAEVQGRVQFGNYLNQSAVSSERTLQDMIAWWEQRTTQIRADCTAGDVSCIDRPDADPAATGAPPCYLAKDGWDAMEGSISGDGCRPTIGAMMYSEALAIAEFATQIGGGSDAAAAQIAAKFTARAERIQEWYLAHLWDQSIGFFGGFMPQWPFGTTGCITAPPEEQLRRWSDTETESASESATGTSIKGCAPRWKCGAVGVGFNGSAGHRSGGGEQPPAPPPAPLPGVRELLGLGPPYYFQIVPRAREGAKYDAMWPQLFDPGGFWAEFGPTTAERRH